MSSAFHCVEGWFVLGADLGEADETSVIIYLTYKPSVNSEPTD